MQWPERPAGTPCYGFGANGVMTRLTPATNYRIILKIRWVHGGPWVRVLSKPFTTNPWSEPTEVDRFADRDGEEDGELFSRLQQRIIVWMVGLTQP